MTTKFSVNDSSFSCFSLLQEFVKFIAKTAFASHDLPFFSAALIIEWFAEIQPDAVNVTEFSIDDIIQIM